MHTITLVCGDPSNDGHGRSDSLTIKSTLSISQLKKAFEAGSAAVGFKLTDYCEAYQDARFPNEHFNTLVDKGFEGTKHEDEDESDYMCTETWFDLYLFICKLGDPNFGFSKDQGKDLYIGGYGIFG